MIAYNVSGIGAGAEFIACPAWPLNMNKERKFHSNRKASLLHSLRSQQAGGGVGHTKLMYNSDLLLK
jgi:hypothetical protein